MPNNTTPLPPPRVSAVNGSASPFTLALPPEPAAAGQPDNPLFDAVKEGDLLIATPEACTDAAPLFAGAFAIGKVVKKTPNDIVLAQSDGRLTVLPRETWLGIWRLGLLLLCSLAAAVLLPGCVAFSATYDPATDTLTAGGSYHFSKSAAAGKEPLDR